MATRYSLTKVYSAWLGLCFSRFFELTLKRNWHMVQVTAAISLIDSKQLEPSLLLNLEYLQSFLSRVPSIRLQHKSSRCLPQVWNDLHQCHFQSSQWMEYWNSPCLFSSASKCHQLGTQKSASSSQYLITLYSNFKTDVLQFVGDLAVLQGSLLSLSVDHCSVSLELLLASSLSSVPSPSPWPALSSLTVTHCCLDKLGTPLALLPALTHLDCSHNK